MTNIIFEIDLKIASMFTIDRCDITRVKSNLTYSGVNSNLSILQGTGHTQIMNNGYNSACETKSGHWQSLEIYLLE